MPIERFVAFPLVRCAISADLFNLTVNVLEQIRQRFSITQIVSAGDDTEHLQRCLIRA